MSSSPENSTPHRYTGALANQIEVSWQMRWEKAEAFRTTNPGEPGFDASAPKFYALDMFPYPSGAGLHVGHPEGYIATDILCRYQRMRGFGVLHPMGWDAFGLPAEQYAVQTGVHPAITTRRAIDTFRGQLKRFGLSYDWSREVSTCEPEFYRWTQWIWLRCYDAWYDRSLTRARPIGELIRAFERGERTPARGPWATLSPAERREELDAHRLAYLGEQTVNWCPKLGTVLANEEVIDGRSERGGYPVLRLPLRQWMFRITEYADRLLADLATVDWPESTRIQQTEWIGRSEGAEIRFPVRVAGESGAAPRAAVEESARSLVVFTTRPDTLFGATYMVIAPEHPLASLALESAAPDRRRAIEAYVTAARNRGDVERQADSKQKSGVDSGLSAVHPVTGAELPIWIADYVLMGYGTGAIMAVPGHDERDFDFARAFNLPVRRVVMPTGGDANAPLESAFTGDGVACSSAAGDLSLDGLPTQAAKARMTEWLESKGLGRRRVNFKLRDWLFSRQRYWGEPFPIVFDESGAAYPISEAHLPVTLPAMEDFKPIESATPTPPLGKATAWVNTTAGEAGVDPALLPPETPVRRETNTMPGWAGSCWYYLRYCDPQNSERFVGRDAERHWMSGGGVDLYVGGAEHAVLHLLYARFWHKILFDLGEVSTPEPFRRLFHQGMITSWAYQRQDKSLVPIDQVEERDGAHVEKGTGDRVTQTIAKMSKSLRNVINPDGVIAEYGADTMRLYEMYMGPLEASKPWNTRDIAGVFRFLQRAWRLAIDERSGELLLAAKEDPALERRLHRTIARVAADTERLAFNTAIAALIELVNAATRPTEMSDPTQGGMTRSQLERFVCILAPFAPHMAEELWQRLGHDDLVSLARWPEVDPAMLVDDEVEIAVQVQGKVKARLRVPAGADAGAIEALVMADETVRKSIGDRPVRKVVVVPGRMVSVVTGG
ncbi:MAG: leucine--tRNA ligase [Phycisphaeraceae bacterium]|nr:leucine--tRNA ligase [Phycisphaeraceae bacterium]